MPKINQIERCKAILKNAEDQLQGLIVTLTVYLAARPETRHGQITKAIAVDHFSKKIKELECIVCELNSDLKQAITESLPKSQRLPKRTIEELDEQRRNDRQDSIKRQREDMRRRRGGPQI